MTVAPFPISDAEVADFLEAAVKKLIARNDTGLAAGERGRLYAWYWGYYGRALVDMYKATSENRYLEIAQWAIYSLLDRRDDALGLVDESRGRILPSWGTRFKNGVRANEITTAGLIALPILEYARVTGERWASEAACETLASFKAERRSTRRGQYYFEHQSEGGVEALNHANAYGTALVHTLGQSDDPWFFDTALGIHYYHMNYARADGEGLSWPYAPSPGDGIDLPSEAIWKAGTTIELPVALSEFDRLPEPFTLKQVAYSVSRHPMVREGICPQFLGTDRFVAVKTDRVPKSLPGFIATWLQIDDAELRSTIFGLMENHPELFPNGWKGGSRTMIMAWAHLRSRGLVTSG